MFIVNNRQLLLDMK